jgi:hypothetical protein
MGRNRPPRRRPEAPSAPTTITELARRYHSCAVALARSLGIPMSETFLLQFHNAISSIFIASDRAGVRLAPSVPLPPLADATVASTNANANVAHNIAQSSPTDVTGDANNVAHNVAQSSPHGQPEPEGPDCTGLVPPPDRVPAEADLPCKGQLIVDLRPAQLSLLIGKVGRLAEQHGGQWEILLAALEAERERRMDKGRKAPREG